MRLKLGELQEQQRSDLRSIAGLRVRADEPPGPCPSCGGPMHVLKTVERRALTLSHGAFVAHETVHACAADCRLPERDGKLGALVIQRQPALARLLPPRCTSGYDVMCFVGRARFVHYQQREEIRSSLEREHGIVLSLGEISALGRRFLVYLEALHEARAGVLRAALESDGGWPLHVDSTGEDGQGTLLVVYAGWRDWVLGAWKIPTERADAILPRLRAVAARFGPPCAVMRDLGRAVIEATGSLIAELGRPIPNLGCHLHFVKDVGKDLLSASHDELRELFRRVAPLSRLRALARDLGRTLDADLAPARQRVAEWLAGADDRFLLPAGNDGLAVVRALAQWVLDYSHDGTDAGFPFDRPYLDLYRRCLRACRATESLLRKPYDDGRVHHMLERLHGLLVPVRQEASFHGSARILEARGLLFDELRDALRLQDKPTRNRAAGLDAVIAKPAELRDVKEAVEQLHLSLRDRRPARGPAGDTREAIDLIVDHLDRHGPSLWGHAIALPPEKGGGVRLAARTNVRLESFFHEMKHGERRRSGRKSLAQDFEQLPAAAALARNLLRPDYVTLLCGTVESLPEAFADLDAADRSTSLPARLRAAPPPVEEQVEIVSASLPKADRTLVRTAPMQARLFAEASSRAPRLSAHPRGGAPTVD